MQRNEMRGDDEDDEEGDDDDARARHSDGDTHDVT